MMGAAAERRPALLLAGGRGRGRRGAREVIREVRPQVLVTYDENGVLRPSRTTSRRTGSPGARSELAADPGYGEGEPWPIAKFYHTAMPRSVIKRMAEDLRRSDVGFLPADAVDEPSYGCADEDVTTEIDAREYVGAKLAALRAHATQVTVRGQWFALSNNIGQEALGVEYFILRAGVPGPAGPGAPYETGGLGAPYDREDDLFAGVDRG